MGSGASNVVRVDLGNKETKSTSSMGSGKTVKSAKSPKKTTEVVKLQEKEDIVDFQQSSEDREKQCEKELDILQKQMQMGELECDNLALLDQVQQLEQQIECLQSPASGTVAESNLKDAEDEEDAECIETVHAKDYMIDQLQQELDASKKEMTKLKMRYKKKIRLLNRRLAESSQEYSFQILELKNQVTKLREAPSASEGNNEEKSNDRTKLILDLSSKVSEQERIIERLESALTDAGVPLPDNTVAPSSSQICVDVKVPQTSSKADVNNPVDSDSTLSELQLIAKEMKSLKLKKKSRKNKLPAEDSDESKSTLGPIRENTSSSIMSSGCSSPSLWSDADADESEVVGDEKGVNRTWSDAKTVKAEKDQLKRSDYGLDPASIRRISAPKDRKKHQRDVINSAGKPPVPASKHTRDSDMLRDVDVLLSKLDQDIGSFPSSVKHSNVTSMSLVSS